MVAKFISIKDKVGYGVGSIAYSLPYTLLGTVYLIYATSILNIPPVIAGTIVAISALWDAVSDPFVGFLSDKTISQRFGRRHLYILSGSLLTALFTWLFWSIDPSYSTNTKIILLTLYILALKTTLTVFVIPYNALGGELASDYDERSSVQSWRAGFYIFGMLLALVLSNIIFFRPTKEFAKGQLNPDIYPQMGLAFAVFVVVFGLAAFYGTRRHIPLLAKSKRFNLKSSESTYANFFRKLFRCLKNHNLRALAIAIFLIEVGFQITVANSILINTYAYNLNGPQMGILGICLLFSSIACQPVWVAFSRKYDKKPALLLAGVLGIIGFALAPWIIVWWKLVPMDSDWLLVILSFFAIIAGLANGAFMSLPFSMISDAIDEAELATGVREEGVYFGVYTFAYKAGISVSLLLSGVILQVIGFDSTQELQSETSIFYLVLVPSWILVVICPIAFYFIAQFKIDRSSHRKLVPGGADQFDNPVSSTPLTSRGVLQTSDIQS